ncbi:MAG TPA: argininosuccinate lyase, partial [Candidatus Dormibacteraeota bacterium]|nr:argininosuccinate lyase [Candidatus Dormibacteraeota bacterium]
MPSKKKSQRRKHTEPSAPRASVPGAAQDVFPAVIYADTVLAANFEDAKRYFLTALLEIHYAHTLMLRRQHILSAAEARICLQAIDNLDLAAIRSASYAAGFEDLFFYIEKKLFEDCGDTAGKMHIARSRNDIDLCLYRMTLRREVLKVAAAMQRVHDVLLDLAEPNTHTLMPAYTHTQPAQPTTLAHYLMAAVELFGRDVARLRSAYATINRSPLGACAITTTGFPIDRDYTAGLLGFEGLQLNSYGAIAAIDYLTEAASTVAVAMINLGRLVQDLLLWCTEEFGFLRLSDSYVQVSSIMPQKRNPVSLEHTRILASKSFSQAQAILTSVHNTPFGDIVDCEDDLQPLAFAVFTDAERALKLFAGVMAHSEVNRERMRRRAEGSFLTVTELADTLVRREALSFRQAHQLVSAAVHALIGKQDTGHETDGHAGTDSGYGPVQLVD